MAQVSAYFSKYSTAQYSIAQYYIAEGGNRTSVGILSDNCPTGIWRERDLLAWISHRHSFSEARAQGL
ncbi:MAG: hypothetical protein CSA20_07295 [Deltaproteobacteria bacterium]|nr:MAG: hypothetical protein CSB32_00960 [Desulfobacterales bacterium]PIE72540.1 MAG: hypothetical protein CSA20_07295 [Deltaproteobacteria bacterium]